MFDMEGGGTNTITPVAGLLIPFLPKKTFDQRDRVSTFYF